MLVLSWLAWDVSGQRAASVRLIQPTGLALDGAGSLYISDIGTHQILKLVRERLTVVAGTGAGGFGGDGGAATRAQLFAPQGLAIDARGNLLVADTFNHRIRRIDRGGTITTIAGNGIAAYAGDGGPAAAAAFNGPQDLAVTADGSIFVADTYNAVVRRIDAAGIVSTFAGSEPGLGGDGGPATKALLNMPSAVAVAPDGAVYVSDAANSRIRRIAADGTIQTVAGTGGGSGLGGAGFTGDGGPAEKSKTFSPMGLRVDAAGNVYICDSGNNRIRIVRNGVISTIAGVAMLSSPQKIAVAADGRLFVADRGNSRIVESR